MLKKIPSELQVLLTHFEWNLQRLNEVIKQEQSDYFKGAALQRFGHTYDIVLKTLRAFAKGQNLPCQTDEQCFETAVNNGWMEKQSDWKEMVADYQRINQKPPQNAETVYEKLPNFHNTFSQIFSKTSTPFKLTVVPLAFLTPSSYAILHFFLPNSFQHKFFHNLLE